MTLVDTSVWIAVFRKNHTFDLKSVVDMEDVVTCLPVIQEILQGFDNQDTYAFAREAMLSLPLVESPLSQDVFLEAIELYRIARRNGITIRSTA